MVHRPESNEGVSQRLKLVRMVFSGENQRQFALRLGIDPQRWNNFERGLPLSKEIAFLLVRKFPGISLDWLYLGDTASLRVSLQRELEAAAEVLQGSKRA